MRKRGDTAAARRRLAKSAGCAPNQDMSRAYPSSPCAGADTVTERQP
ncbi:hypothetical protein HMPREF0185_02356 [Brevundimonas diminuta 470-4]|nr:hypothetical protein HMPREF0185_02356 [Brevundimonas diminuta 470-4]